MFVRCIHSEIAAGGLRDKIFDAEIVAALVHALGDEDSEIRSSAANFFTTAVVQGVPCRFHGTVILK